MHTQPNLDAQLATLQIDTANWNVLRKLSWDTERRIIAEVYVWWRSAVAIDGYLERCYEKNDITHNKKKDGVNFRPLLKLVTESQMDSNDLFFWSQALLKIHSEVESDAQHFEASPVESIEHYIETKGGKTGLAGYHKKKAPEPDEDEIELSEFKLFELSESEFLPVLQKEARAYYSSKPHQAPIALPALHITDEGYSVVVVRKEGNGIVLVGTTNDPNLIDTALVKTYRNDFEALPLTLRSILEPLHILNVPRTLASSFEKYIENSDVRDTWDRNGRKEKSYRRLIYRPATSDFLLSHMSVSVGSAVIAKPKTGLIERDKGDIFLPSSTRQSVEVRLLHQGLFNLFVPSSDDQYITVPPGHVASNFVSLETKVPVDDSNGVIANQIKRLTGNLKHPPLSFIPFYELFGKPRWQVAPNNDSFAPVWTAELSLDWLRDAATNFLDAWLKEYGNKAKREINRTLNIGLSDWQVCIGYEFDVATGYTLAQTLPLRDKASGSDIAVQVRSTDFAFALRQIADLNVQSAIKIQATKSAVVLYFETTASQYECWIPGCEDNGERDATHFTPYHPVQSAGLDFEPDDLEPEMTEKEKATLEANIKRLQNTEHHKKVMKGLYSAKP
jgi:hypothetical protein